MALRSLSRLVSESTMKSLLERSSPRNAPLSSVRRLAVAATQEAAAQEEGAVERPTSRGRSVSGRDSGIQLRNIIPLLG